MKGKYSYLQGLRIRGKQYIKHMLEYYITETVTGNVLRNASIDKFYYGSKCMHQ